ncbi:hypothetical protein VB618_05700 [Microvirga sp. CF3062]|uniref:hypothetical protein n=1 Tax=Microvirga sp. CF3062 TaxID=3110182 RepID=UPI002E7860D6|nr:hypothetical protein [Microvirga sp. CF3062]MEE1655683.1 hypothetical protein [Microvirga sp. CF3062]
MDEFEIEVVGAASPHKHNGALTRTLKTVGRCARTLLMRPRVLALTGAAAFVMVVGTPHVGWDYECRYSMRPGQPCRSVSYCAYYGMQGRRVVFPEDGESCKLVTFLRIDWRGGSRRSTAD